MRWMRGVALVVAGAALVVAGAALLAGCGDDATAPPDEAPTPPPIDLTEMWHPLSSLEESYAQRNIERYRTCLDADYYRFYYATAAAAPQRGDTYWTYAQDTAGMSYMFNPQLPVLNLRVVKLEFDLVFDKDTIAWTPVDPGDPADETWYLSTVGYTFTLELGSGDKYRSKTGAAAEITVRQHPDDGLWRIVRVTDLTAALVSAGE